MKAVIEELEPLTLIEEQRSDLASLLQVLFDRRYTGPITLHFRMGTPYVADLPTPKIRLTP